MRRCLTVVSLLAVLAFVSPLVVAASSAKSKSIQLATRFGDHMVLQRQMPIPLEGMAPSNTRLTVTLGDKSVSTKSGASGAWKVKLPAFEAGGPYTLTVASKSQTLSVQDVLVGEVWFASGQSNMEWILNQVKDADQHIKNATNTSLRLFTQKQTLAASPKFQADGAWAVCSPEAAKNFSAVGYFFGRDLQEKLKVPVGVVCAAWGGSAAESWMTTKALSGNKDLKPIMKRYFHEKSKTRKEWIYGAPRMLEFKNMKLIPKDSKKEARAVGQGDWTAWARSGSPVSFQWVKDKKTEEKVGRYFGKLQAAAWGGTGTALNGGKPDDLSSFEFIEADMRGKGVFKMELTQPSIRDYDYPCSQPITLTKNWTKVRMPIAQFKQNGWGLAKPFTQNELVNIQFQVVMGDLPALPAAMYNGMVAPWVKTPMRGAIWYQGETNAWRAEQYDPLLKTLIGEWRSAWKNPNFAFLTVQLPIFDATKDGGEAGTWPELREAQAKSLSLKHTGVVTILDLGMRDSIHPIYKEPVGYRLALAAMNVAYGHKDGLCPLYASHKVEGYKVTVSFTNTEGGLKAKGKVLGFAVAGEDKVFVPAEAKIVGETVVVSSPKVVSPVAVRYGWADVTDANLCGKTGLPVSPFRTDNWKLITHGRR
jgi:sialate O-acetylesterase